jgi:electron transport complex protein RnfA
MEFFSGDLFRIFSAALLVNNIVLSRFLGICPFLGVSSRRETAVGMGLAVIFVIMASSAVTWIVYNLVLDPLGIPYLYTLSFILIIASLVQFVEMVIKKMNQALYRSLGIFLPLITTNCAVLGVSVINMNEGYSFLQAMVHALGASLGFFVAIRLMAGLREQMADNDIPEFMKGLPITLVTTGLMSLAFLGFSGMLK